MPRNVFNGFFLALLLAGTVILAGCLSPPARHGSDEPVIRDFRDSQPAEPRAMHQFTLGETDQQVVGRLQVIYAQYEDTFPDIARRFNLGYDELMLANPDIDPWLPGEDSIVYLPTQHVLPDAPRDGIVLNLANMRLFYYPPIEPPMAPVVITHPIGIGRVGWSTPLGSTKVVRKTRDPAWHVPASIRRERAEEGDPLPAVVPPGPDNPLGQYALRLGMESYLIHGTNKPYGVGMRVSHGCIRLYPEDIELLFDDIPLNTPVHIVNQPVLAGWQDGVLFLESHMALEDDEIPDVQRLTAVIDNASGQYPDTHFRVDWSRAGQMMREPMGIAMPLSENAYSTNDVLRSAHLVLNQLPNNATYDGSDDQDEQETVPSVARDQALRMVPETNEGTQLPDSYPNH